MEKTPGVTGGSRRESTRRNNKLSTPKEIIVSNSAHDVFRTVRRDGAANRSDSYAMSSPRLRFAADDVHHDALLSPQVEGTPTPIVPGRVSKIPPIYERPTTSNISEEGGVHNVSKSCNRQPQPLSVTRGVRSRPLGDVTSTKVETMPLLSPTMESEFLKAPWTFPRTKTNSSIKEEGTATFPAWEEDFQDLSSWCMDPFQVQCDFRIGESTTFKLSGTKYEGNGVSTVEEEGILKDLKSATDDEKLNLKMNTVKTIEESGDNRHLLLSPSELVNDGLGYNNEKKNATSSWLMSPESVASTSTASSKQRNADVDAMLQPEYRAGGDLACPTSPLDTIADQREMWDELRTIETTGSDTFDLLSYLCDDEMRSLEGSTDSSAIKLRSHATVLPPLSSFTPTKVKIEEETNEPIQPTRRRMSTRATSTVTSSSVEAPPVFRRSERTRTTSIKETSSKETEAIVSRAKTRDKNGRKRYYEESEDSEDDIGLSQYRECREKNNEASRRSRMNKKAKESEMSVRAIELERDNKVLKMKVEELEKLVTSMRNALLRSALKGVF
ncbi:hypothetical protein EAG_13126 [Camponotus floridanus]|uniref:BZIP domain-containing protein n=2 Tax=Camponotus floridanus TaxID=104421 RepID=E2ADY2_CAMFO|nr:hypothetical protein EAG_13126 [Camponotus floridanus]